MRFGIQKEDGTWLRMAGRGNRKGRIVPYETRDEAEGHCKPGETVKPLRGFAAMSTERVQAFSAKGGARAWATGNAHRFTHDEASAAGRKGAKVANAARQPRTEVDSSS